MSFIIIRYIQINQYVQIINEHASQLTIISTQCEGYLKLQEVFYFPLMYNTLNQYNGMNKLCATLLYYYTPGTMHIN